MAAGTDKGTPLAVARELFEREFSDVAHERLLAVHAPARSEISGNHTDHEGGHVVAGALDVSIEGVAALNGTMTGRARHDGRPRPRHGGVHGGDRARPGWL